MIFTKRISALEKEIKFMDQNQVHVSLEGLKNIKKLGVNGSLRPTVTLMAMLNDISQIYRQRFYSKR